MPAGRPSDYSENLADEICERIADGESLRAICRDAAMPNKSTVFRWLATNKGFQDQYATSKEEQAESHADDLKDIADNCTDPQKARLQIDVRKWIASKLKPKKYGDKMEVAHGITEEMADVMKRIRSRE